MGFSARHGWAAAGGPVTVPVVCPSARRRILQVLLLMAAAALALPAGAADPEARVIVERANQASYYAGQDGRSEARMRIVDAQGREQLRQFTLLRRNDEGGRQQYLVVFSRPADVRHTGFLVHKNPGADDDRWLYLPGLDLVRRIAPGDKRTSFVGSHVFYEDVSGRHLEEDEFVLIEHTDEHHLIRGTPRRAGSAEFAYYHAWIDRQTDLPVRIDYFNDSGEVYRRMLSSDIRVIDGYPTATQMRVEDLASGGHTLVQFRFSAYDLGIPAEVFTERSLRSPPARWLQRVER